MRDLAQLQAVTDSDTMLKLLKEWTANSKNPDLLKFRDCVLRNTFYTNNLEMQLQTTDRLIDEARLEVNRAVLRAQRAEESIETLEKEIKSLKASLNAFGL